MPRALDKLILTNGNEAKSLNLSSYDPAWHVFGTDTPYHASTVQEYRRVPYLYACVDKRAKALSSMPYRIYMDGSDEDISNSDQFRGIRHGLRTRLYLTEAAICLYGAAYWLQSTNRFGRNSRYDWIVPSSIVPRYEPLRGLDYFQRTVTWSEGNQSVERHSPITDKRGDMAYFWLPNLTTEIGPGVAPAIVAMAGAGILGNMTQHFSNYFMRGAMRTLLIKVPQGASQGLREQVDSWFYRFMNGVRNSFRAKALDERVTVDTIGDSPDDIASDVLTTQAREDVCAAMGVPHSLLSADAANYATSQQDTLNFYQQTIIPSAALIAETITDQILPNGVYMEFDPSQLEVFQQHEVSKAQAISQLVGQPVLTIDEAREMLGYEPLGGTQPSPDSAPAEQDNGKDVEMLKCINRRLDELAFWTGSENEYTD